MTRLRRWLVLPAMVFALAGWAGAQGIGVTVDGTPVSFTGVGPQMVDGRILVPLRGVLEQIGATVDWDPATRRVMAQKDNRIVILPIGFRTAMVDGRTVTLDVPARIMLGTTMVPLRFLGEALGADVKWFGTIRLVEIVTGPSEEVPSIPAPPPTGGAGPEPAITSLTHDATGWLTAGSRVRVVMLGTPDGEATFEIPGIAERVLLTEETPGRYTGTWTVPSGAGAASNPILGTLRLGSDERSYQSSTPVRVDTVPPEIRNLLPEDGAAIRELRPTIAASLEDVDSGVDPASVRLRVDGVDVTARATVTGRGVAFRPAAPMRGGYPSVEVTARDRAGNAAEERWSFELRGGVEPRGITSITYNAPSRLQPGDDIRVTLSGRPGAIASFWILTAEGYRLATVPMEETTPGVYSGAYTVRRGDDLRDARVFGSLGRPGGEIETIEAAAPIPGGRPSGRLRAPVITSPIPGAAVRSPLIVRGTAAPGSQVSIKIEYVTYLFGAIEYSSTLGERTVEVDRRGQFASEPISLGTLIQNRRTEYTLTAVTMGPRGRESEPSIVTFTRTIAPR